MTAQNTKKLFFFRSTKVTKVMNDKVFIFNQKKDKIIDL